jgi:tRNA-splicing ligase RtcB
MQFEKNKEEETDIIRFIKIKPKNKVFKLKTISGNEIVATEDHPFWTPKGMIPIREIKNNDSIAIYPFSGVEYEEPPEDIIIEENDILNLELPFSKKLVIEELKKRNLLPLKLNSSSTPLLIKILSFNMGDGTLIFTNKSQYATFYGTKENLELIRKDVRELGYTPSKIHSRKRKHKIKTKYGIVKFTFIENSFYVGAKSFVILLHSLGTPLGDKANRNYLVPDWIMKSPLWHKRLFLASMFGAEMSSPSTLTGHGYNFYMPYMSVNKISWLADNGKMFLGQIASLLSEFGVKTSEIKAKDEYLNQFLEITKRIKLLINGDSENLIKLYGTIGFEYNLERKFLANVAIQYLKLKQLVIQQRLMSQRQAIALYQNGICASEIFERLESDYVNKRFLERSLYEGRKTSPRVASTFPTFLEFVKNAVRNLGKGGMVWDKIVSKEEIEYGDFVYDFTVAHDSHNFIANNFVVSNCGVRLLRTNLTVEEIKPKLKELLDSIFKNVPSGVGEVGKLKLSFSELDEVLVNGGNWAVENGYATKKDLEHLEENGCMKGASAENISNDAKKRGAPQLGTLGAGNHFLEIQSVDKIFLPEVAKVFGIEKEGQVLVMIHTGSRGFGHQVCTDYLRILESKFRDEIRKLPDRELVYAPAGTKECEDYFASMAAAANYAWTNRSMIMHWVRESFAKILGMKLEDIGLEVVYDVAHNIGKVEEYEIDGEKKKVYLHRKGATRAFPAGSMDIPKDYRNVGQPVLLPGSIGTASFILVGAETAKETFYSTAHGAGRVSSRSKMLRELRGEEVARSLAQKGILSRSASWKVMAEEAPEAYKDIDEVARVTQEAGISRRVVRLVPLGVIKG